MMILAIILAKLRWTRSLEQVAVPLRRIISQKKRKIKTEETKVRSLTEETDAEKFTQ